MNRIDMVDRASLRDDIPTFGPGDTVDVYVRVVEGTRERVQKFTGIVIRRQGGGIQETFTVRKVTQGVGVERTFPIHSPIVSKIERITLGDVRRAKLYYLRDRVGRAVVSSPVLGGARRGGLAGRAEPAARPAGLVPAQC